MKIIKLAIIIVVFLFLKWDTYAQQSPANKPVPSNSSRVRNLPKIIKAPDTIINRNNNQVYYPEQRLPESFTNALLFSSTVFVLLGLVFTEYDAAKKILNNHINSPSLRDYLFRFINKML